MSGLKKIAVILPIEYRGGSLRSAIELSKAIKLGSAQAGFPCQVIFGHLDIPGCYSDEDLMELDSDILIRPYRWKKMERNIAKLAMKYACVEGQSLTEDFYYVLDDGMNYFMDCETIIFLSDRAQVPLLPVYSYSCLVHDYIQRYVPFQDDDSIRNIIKVAQGAKKILVTTDTAFDCAIQYAGVGREKIVKVPFLVPDFTKTHAPRESSSNYIIWTTNSSLHKNQLNVMLGLVEYYEKHDGKLKCFVTGYNSQALLKGKYPHLKEVSKLFKENSAVRENVEVRGELSDHLYRDLLSLAAFLLHSSKADAGTYAAVEAACLGVPCLSSDYPAMREFDRHFKLNTTFMSMHDYHDIAKKLKLMEQEFESKSKELPSLTYLQSLNVENQAQVYWRAIENAL